jgi:hypothetical protein
MDFEILVDGLWVECTVYRCRHEPIEVPGSMGLTYWQPHRRRDCNAEVVTRSVLTPGVSYRLRRDGKEHTFQGKWPTCSGMEGILRLD